MNPFISTIVIVLDDPKTRNNVHVHRKLHNAFHLGNIRNNEFTANSGAKYNDKIIINVINHLEKDYMKILKLENNIDNECYHVILYPEINENSLNVLNKITDKINKTIQIDIFNLPRYFQSFEITHNNTKSSNNIFNMPTIGFFFN